MRTNVQYSDNMNLAFRARNVKIRTADEICRRVNNEFIVSSSSAIMLNSKNYHHNENSKKFVSTIQDLIKALRNYYDASSSSSEELKKMFAGMKKVKVGNCYEKAHATLIALKANGFKNVRNFSLFSISPDGQIKDLDHIVTAINFKIPKHYEFDNPITIGQLLKPNNDAIIIDSWAGVADNAKSMVARYKGNINLTRPKNKSLLDKFCSLFKKKSIEKQTSQIVFLPQQSLYLDTNDIKYFRKKYPGLLLKKNISKDNEQKYNLNEDIAEIPDYIIQNIKNKHHSPDNITNTKAKNLFSLISDAFCDPSSCI